MRSLFPTIQSRNKQHDIGSKMKRKPSKLSQHTVTFKFRPSAQSHISLERPRKMKRIITLEGSSRPDSTICQVIQHKMKPPKDKSPPVHLLTINTSKLLNCKFEKETSAGGDLSHINNASFNFRWNLNMTLEQFEEKKKKFDTQKKVEPRQEEVIQEVQMQRSRASRVMQGSREFESTYKEEQEEGSVYQSIYE